MRGSMLSSRAMARPRPTHCPTCDASLLCVDGKASTEASSKRPTHVVDPSNDPVCPACEQRLVPVRVASATRRLGAALVDTAILFVTAGLLNWALLGMLDAQSLLGSATGLDAVLRILELDPATPILRTAPFFAMSGLYLGLFWMLTGRTPGQRLLELRVIDAQGRTPSPLRVGVRLLGLALGLIPVGLGWLWTAFDLERRAWHDHLARTYVVRDAPSRAVHETPRSEPVVRHEVVREA
jgi:uncharacterized RDD family membrane protein YckC